MGAAPPALGQAVCVLRRDHAAAGSPPSAVYFINKVESTARRGLARAPAASGFQPDACGGGRAPPYLCLKPSWHMCQTALSIHPARRFFHDFTISQFTISRFHGFTVHDFTEDTVFWGSPKFWGLKNCEIVKRPRRPDDLITVKLQRTVKKLSARRMLYIQLNLTCGLRRRVDKVETVKS